MKEQIQNTGVRKWFGDDFISIQAETMAAIAGLLGAFGAQFIVEDCVVAGTTVSAGLVALNHEDGFKICRLQAATGLTFPCYLKVVKTEETRAYLDGATKPVAYTYTAVISATNEGGYLELKADGSTPRFTDVIQDANHRFVTDAEKLEYSGQSAAALTAIRGGVVEAYNTLEKLRADLQAKLDVIDVTNAQEIYATIRGEVDAAYDTLEEMKAYIDNLSYLPEYMGSATLANGVIDFAGKPILRKEMVADTAFTATNLIENKSMTLRLTGGFTPSWPAYFKRITGVYDGSAVNLVQMLCTNSTVGSEEVWFTISQQE
jgi:DNA-binding Lrp family transcriptional regulator